jgi:hypothetical protein
MRAIARKVGYHALYFGHIGLVADHGDPFSLNRIAVERITRHDEFSSPVAV